MIFDYIDEYGEKWVNIPDYPNYMVSENGKFFNKKTNRYLKPIFHNRMTQINLTGKDGIKHTVNAKKIIQIFFGKSIIK